VMIDASSIQSHRTDSMGDKSGRVVQHVIDEHSSTFVRGRRNRTAFATISGIVY
jgi:hypothetical protein